MYLCVCGYLCVHLCACVWLGICNCNCICILSLYTHNYTQSCELVPVYFLGSHFSLSLAQVQVLMQLHCDAAAGCAADVSVDATWLPHPEKVHFSTNVFGFQVFWFCCLFIFRLCTTNMHMLLFLVQLGMSICVYARVYVCVCAWNCIRLVLKVALYMHILCA